MGTINGTSDNDHLVGTNEDDLISGLGGQDRIEGGAGDDVLDGGPGADLLHGGTGNDTYQIDLLDSVVEFANEGIDRIVGALSFRFVLPDNVENFTATPDGGGTSQTLHGNALNNRIFGSDRDDMIGGRYGDDLLVGGAGRDHFSGSQGRDVIVAGSLSATDLIVNGSFETVDGANSSRDYILAGATTSDGVARRTTATLAGWQSANAAPIELATGAGSAMFNAAGGRVVLEMEAAAGQNLALQRDIAGVPAGTAMVLSLAAALPPGAPAGAPVTARLEIWWNGELVGTIVPDSAQMTQHSFALYAAQSGPGAGGSNRLELRETGSADGYGTMLDEVSLRTVIDSGEDETIYYFLDMDFELVAPLINLSASGAMLDGVFIPARSARDTFGTIDSLVGIRNVGGPSFTRTVILGSEEDNQLRTGNGDDEIDGGGGNDLIDGGRGNDQMRGGTGDDRYFVSDAGDLVEEAPDEGTDIVSTYLRSYTLGQNVENLSGGLFDGQHLIGNALANRIFGLSGADTLEGLAGNDYLYGGPGIDLMRGGAGDDTYHVEEAGDVIEETAGEGDDHVESRALNYILPANVERLSGLRWEGQVLAGNALANTIVGNMGADFIDGAGGSDVMRGGAGDDVYYVDHAGDQAIELADEGRDEIRTTLASFSLASVANIENLAGLSGAGQTLSGTDSDNVITGGAGGDLLEGLGGSDTLIGGGGIDRMRGGGGDDNYEVDQTGDIVEELAGEGRDIVTSRAASYTLADHVEWLLGADGAQGRQLIGNSAQNFIRGSDGDDRIDGGGDADYMQGLGGNDIYYVDHSGDNVGEFAGEGTDEIRTALASYSLAPFAEVENLTGTSGAGQLLTGNAAGNLIVGGSGGDTLSGGDGNDFLHGENGNDILEGGLGDDLLRGGSGVDQYDGGGNPGGANFSGAFGDRISFYDQRATQGAVADLRTGIVSNDGFGNAETMTGIESLAGDTAFADTFHGNDNRNAFIVGRGDTVYGYGGDDRIHLGMAALFADGGAGRDLLRVRFVGQFLLPDANGDGLAELAPAPAAGWIVDLRSGFIRDGHGNHGAVANFEDVEGSDLGDQITGNGVTNVISGGAGNDVLNGAGGSDRTEGGLGNDLHYVDHVGDIVVELEGEGVDTVASAISYILAANVEHLQANDVSGSAPLHLTGNALANTIYATQGDNILNGAGGADFMVGYAGNDLYYVDHVGDVAYEMAGGGVDTVIASISFAIGANIESLQANDIGGSAALTLTGNELSNQIYATQGNNVLNGGGGADFMVGYAGHDLYYVDDLGDLAFEMENGGNDVVVTTISFTLGAHVENLQANDIVGTQALVLTGNALANTIYGTNGNNVLNGAGGADFMAGYGGHDLYYVDNANDVAYEDVNGGNDIVVTTVSYGLGGNVENLQANDIGGTAALTLVGNDLANTIWGTQGDNALYGRGGNDRIYGYGGADRFVFDSAAGDANFDWLDDFQAGVDKIVLDNAIFSGLADGALPANAFVTGGAAADADDRILFNPANGGVFYDADGSGAGAALLIAIVPIGQALTAADFVVI